MVRKKLATAVIALGAMQIDAAAALGLGEIKLESALNQPLDAEITLLNTEDLDNSQVIVDLASTEDFNRAGVERSYFLTTLRFSVEVDGAGNGVIHVSTREPVVEPYVDFVLEARWPNGRLLREYTVLLDLPVFSDEAASSVTAAASRMGQEAPAEPKKSVTDVSRANDDVNARQLPEATGDQEYRVQHSDTLWAIALKARPDSSYSVPRTMVALQQINPDAFFNGNINELKSGYVLRFPSAEELDQLSEQQAHQQVARQNRVWRGEEGGTELDAVQLDARQNSADAPTSGESAAQLSIASAGSASSDMTGGSSAEGAAGGSAGLQQLKNELAVSEESLDKAQRENAELQSRMDDMQQQMATLQRLLTLKEDQLNALQNAVQEDGSEVSPESADQGESDPLATDGEMATQASDSEVAPAQSEKKVEPVVERDTRTVRTVTTTPEPSLLDTLKANALYIGGGVVGLLAALLLLRRRKSDEADEQLADDPSQPIEYEQPSDESVDGALGGSLEEEAAEDLVESVEEDALEAESEAPAQVNPDQVAEADISIAFGQFDQAEALLKELLENDPDNADFKVKLAQVYANVGNREGFEQLSGELSDADAGVQAQLEGFAQILEENEPSSSSSFDAPDDEDSTVEMSALNLDETGVLDVLEEDQQDASETESELGDLSVDPVLDLDEELEFSTDSDEGGLDLDDSLDASDFDLDSLGSDETTQEISLDLDDGGDDLDALVDSAAAELEQQESGLSTGDDESFSLDLGESLDLEESDESGSAEDTLSFDSIDNTQEISSLDLGATAEMELGDLDLDLDLESDSSDASEEEFSLDIDLGGDEESASLDLEEEAAGEFDMSELSIDEDLATVTQEMESVDLQDELSSELDDSDLDLSDLDVSDDLSVDSLAATDADEGSQKISDNSEDEWSFLSEEDEVATKLDLARAYIDMGDVDGAKEILVEVKQEGTPEQTKEANELLDRI